MNSYYIREHEMQSTTEGTYCKHCNTRTGIGFYVFTRCELRFNEPAFKRYLEFKNLSPIGKKYIRRFSNELYTRTQLMKDFKATCDKKLTRQVVATKPFVCENAL